MEDWRKEYYKLLEQKRKLFGWKYKIELAEEFDPRRWARSYFFDKKPKIKWDNLNFYDECLEEEKSIDIWLLIPSENDTKEYDFRIKYRPDTYNRGNNSSIIKYYPYEFEHSCIDTFSTGTSGHKLYCKHLYVALKFIDEEISPNYREIAKITFTPNEEFLEEVKWIEKTNAKASEKLEMVFKAMEKMLSLEEGFLLKMMNRRLANLRKV